MSKAKWSPEKTWKFVTEYRKRECLWNTKINSYKDRQVKHNAYIALAEIFGCDGVHDVKIKIKNLRTTYIQEYKKIQESIKTNNGKSNGLYVPSLVWYKEMDSFLRYSGCGKMVPIHSENSESKADYIEEINIKEEALTIFDDEEYSNIVDVQQSRPETYQNKELTPQITTKKRKLDSYINTTHLTAVTDNDAYEEHEFDIFGKSVAKQLKSFSSIAAALRVQSRIQALLTEERIQDQIAASHANSQGHNSSTNQRFFYNQKSSNSNWSDTSTSGTEVISVMVPSSSTQDVSNLSNDSCNSNSFLDDNRDYEVALLISND